MRSKHPEYIHGHLQRAKVCFLTIRIFPNISAYFRIKFFFIPNQWETLVYGAFLVPCDVSPGAEKRSCQPRRWPRHNCF